MRSVFVLGLAALLVFSACGHPPGVVALPPRSPTTNPGAGFDVTVTENSHAVTLHVGQTLAVVLHARPGMASWTSVRSSDQSVLSPIVNPAASAVRGVTLAAFRAIATGTARVSATAAPDCSPGQACPAYVMLLTIEVTVTAA
jgi:hypothetical protein